LQPIPLVLQFDAPIYLAAICWLFLYAIRYYIFTPIALSIPRRLASSKEAKLNPDIDPFVSIVLPLYNERNVVDRLLSACTSLGYPDYEVIVVDDSTDDTTQKLEKWKSHPHVKVIHRQKREGWKGGALNTGISNADPRSTHVLVFDADFVPTPGLIERFLLHFENPSVQIVQGYQKHDLNADENWVTKAIRILHSTTYKVELEARSKLGMFVPVMGSVFMARTEVLKKIKFDADITEDYNLTLRLYLKGYKVVYDSGLVASGECPSSVPRVLKQIGRWAEGTTRNTKQYFWKIVKSKQLSIRQKLDFVLTGFSYLNGVLLLLATVIGITNLFLLKFDLYYPPLWIATNLTTIAIPSAVIVQAVGLYRDNAKAKLRTLPYSVLMSYILVPVTAYYSLRGLLREQKWFHRTFKTGKIVQRFSYVQGAFRSFAHQTADDQEVSVFFTNKLPEMPAE
jgi:cellulose synthase/poly-beta-1,6-N-acetylglucosamine synthase-like glycosyltransferase